MNWRRGFWRIYAVVAASWIGLLLWLNTQDGWYNPVGRLEFTFIPPIAGYVLFFKVIPWIGRGFK